MSRPKVWILANWNGWIMWAVHCIHHWQPRLLQMWLYAFWAVQSPNHFPVADAKLPRRVEFGILSPLSRWHSHLLAYCRKHLHHLCIVFDWFRENNLKLKPSKYNFYREEITYLAHWVSKEGVQPINSNLKAIIECMPPQTCTEMHAFLGKLVIMQDLLRGLHILHSHSMIT